MADSRHFDGFRAPLSSMSFCIRLVTRHFLKTTEDRSLTDTAISPGCHYAIQLKSKVRTLGISLRIIIQINIKLFVYPRWTPANVTDTICGYPCQTAVADYLGRRWSVWYTTEIPVTAGPWLLWGLPGLVLQAVDQDRLFVFRAKEIGYAPADRSGHLEHLAERSKRLHSYPISRMEQTLNKVKSSYEAMDRMQGGSGFVIKANDDGTMEKFVPELKYIPLIPDEYWKKQDK